MSTVAITDHPYEGADDGLTCNHDPLGPDVDLCSMPRTAHDHPCMHATRPHTHHGDGWITAYARDHSWQVTVTDDGSVCRRDVTPVPPRYPPDKVMAMVLSGVDRANRDARYEGKELN